MGVKITDRKTKMEIENKKSDINKKIIFDSQTTQKTQQDNNRSLGELESQGVSISKPCAGQYVRIKPGLKLKDLIWVNVAFYTDAQTQKETQYIILGDEPEVDRKLQHTLQSIIKPCILVPYQDNGGNESIWIVKQPGKGQTMMTTHSSSIRAVKGMLEGWRMVWFKNLKVGYCCEMPEDQDAFEDYEFGKFSISDLINFAFGDDIVRTLEHDLVKAFKGRKN
jgi:hypothetical protein|tara:strand:+ start:121 stop:789 length:669 start_codon:yes stop_codon:yes gene_type:complete